MKSFIHIDDCIREIRTVEGKEIVRFISPVYRTSGKDIMKKGREFYAVANPETGMWTTDESAAYEIIDNQLYSYRDKHYKYDEDFGWVDSKKHRVVVEALNNSETGRLKAFKDWLRYLAPNHNFRSLDGELTFASDEVKPEDYRSKRLSYDLAEGDHSSYDEIMDTLYSKENRDMIEWSVGSVLAGWDETKHNDHIVVMYGAPGTGKSTVLKIIEEIFEGYWAPFEVNDVVQSKAFAKAAFKDNPLVAIQDDGSLKRIDSEDMNKIASHSSLEINEKNKGQYNIVPRAICFVATNEPVDLSDSRNGMNRRLLDAYPTGKKITPRTKYNQLMFRVKMEIPAIAKYCLDRYKELGSEYYVGYVPGKMQEKTNYILNFMLDNINELKDSDPISKATLYNKYKEYADASGFKWKKDRIEFGEQILPYYEKYAEYGRIDGRNTRCVYSGLKLGKIFDEEKQREVKSVEESWLDMTEQRSLFDELYSEAPAQLEIEESDGGAKPGCKWANCETKLKDIDTSKVHYVKTQSVDPNLIVIDFDLCDSEGHKSYTENKKEAMKWPETYAELSKSGQGIHLHYIYSGDVSKLKRVYATLPNGNIEIKVFTGDASLRRRLTKCNNVQIKTLSSGLPMKEGDILVDWKGIENERHLRSLILKGLKKEVHPNTKPSIDYISYILEQAYKSGMKYDVSDLQQACFNFALGSHHQSDYCLKAVSNMKFRSDDELESVKDYDDLPIIFFDCEVFPNLFLVCWKIIGEGNPVNSMINPLPEDIDTLIRSGRLVGFNNRDYDNHMLFACSEGYSNEKIFELSQRIIVEKDRSAKFASAYGISYTDIYQYASTKQSLKKWEIQLENELGRQLRIHHHELGLPWDRPVDISLWDKVADYCKDDVLATEAVWNATQGDFLARKILADIANLTPNDTTNKLTTRIIFGKEKHPGLIWTDFKTGKQYGPGENPPDYIIRAIDMKERWAAARKEKEKTNGN